MDQSISISVRGEEFILDQRRAIYWPTRKVLLATDLHWGKTTFFQKHGIALPDKIFDEDLTRLGRTIQYYGARILIVLGDLVHHELGLSDEMVEKVAWFRAQVPCELILIKGNHDRFVHFPESWGIVEEKSLEIDQFAFSHEFKKKTKHFQFSGHVHPMMSIRAGNDSVRFPVFMLDEDYCLLPAFSLLTGGEDIKLLKRQRAFGIVENTVVDLDF